MKVKNDYSKEFGGSIWLLMFSLINYFIDITKNWNHKKEGTLFIKKRKGEKKSTLDGKRKKMLLFTPYTFYLMDYLSFFKIFNIFFQVKKLFILYKLKYFFKRKVKCIFSFQINLITFHKITINTWLISAFITYRYVYLIFVNLILKIFD